VLVAEKRELAAAAAAQEAFFTEEMARMQTEVIEARSKLADVEASNTRLEKRISVEESKSRNRKIILICLVLLIVVRTASSNMD
jgi:phage shock protein A